jgi:hypothetical protein
MKEIDLSGFHFHLFPEKSYVAVDPQSDAEDRVVKRPRSPPSKKPRRYSSLRSEPPPTERQKL